MTVAELIRAIQKPVSIYVDEIIKAFHKKLSNDLLSVGKCTNPADCNTKTDERKLCKSCKCWFKELKDSHEKGKNPSWHKNCSSSKWSEDPWEVAKYFMPALGSNHSAVKGAESTDLPSLLNVLEWMKDAAFLGETRVNVDLVRKLRSQVRNTWAHAPQQELTDDKKKEGFSIAADFLKDLENVGPNSSENLNCLNYLEHLMTKGVTGNVVECELQSLLLQRQMLDAIKEEITNMKLECSSDKTVIQEQLVNLERALNEWSAKMCDFKSFKENIDKQFNQFAEEIKSFRGIPDAIHEIQKSIGLIRDDLAKLNKTQKVEPMSTSCLPDKLINFAGREAEIQKVIDLLQRVEKAVVSLHGGPGFGKTAIAIQVSHQLSEEHKIPVFFSQLITATNQDEMIRQLCLDVGVNHEDNPKQALMLWLKNIKRGVMFVIDDIDNLLRERTSFYKFLIWLRKNSNQQCQIVTTSRASFEIPELSTQKIQIYEMDDRACVELLKKQCPQNDVNFLRQLAKLCGNIPLAMCIAASRMNDFEDSAELLQHLKKQPMKTLECTESDQYINRAINMSYEKCLDEEQKMLGRLSVFEGSFSKSAAGTVIEKDNFDTTNTLKKLVSLSLIKESTNHRYSIHLLIKHFLMDKQESRKDAGDEKAEAKRAKVLMVEYFLKLAHQLTMESYSKDGYKDAREALKQDASNIQNILKICCQQKDPTSSDISDCLQRSKIYNTSAKFFSLFVRTIIPGSIVDEFLQRCTKMADEKNQLAIKINFDCLMADQERAKTIGSHDDRFISKMEEIKKEFDTHYEDLKKDTALCAYYYYLYRSNLLRQSESHSGKERLDLQVQAREYMEKSLELSEAFAGTPSEKADKVFSLLHLGSTWKIISASEHWLKENKASKTSSTEAEKYYREAIQLSQAELGDHELTSSCHKSLGDLFLKIGKHDLAEEMYNIAGQMREKLGLDASERHVLLLNNLGICLSKSNRANEAIKFLERARDTSEKLAESDKPNDCKAKVYTSLAIAHDLKQNSSEAVGYARKAMEFPELKKVITKTAHNKVLKILKNSNH